MLLGDIEAHVRIESQGDDIHLYPDPKQSYTVLKPQLYELINKLYTKGNIVIHDTPPCVLPDATELLAVPSTNTERVQACANCSRNNTCPGVPTAFLATSPPESFKPWTNAPRELAIEVNRACMFACSFCFYKNFYLTNDKFAVPKERLYELIDEAVALGTTTIRFFGGDPLLRKDILEILAYGRSKGQYIIINTNGIFKDNEQMQQVVDAVDKIVISMHGCDEETQQILTGRADMFKKIMLNLKRIATYAPDKLVASALITTYLIERFDEYAALVEKLGVKNWGMNRPMFSKEGHKTHEWLRFSKEDVLTLAEKCLAFKKRTGIDVKMNNYPWCMFPEELHQVLQKNHDYNGVTRLFYDTQGYFKPVASMNVNLGATFKEAWEKNQFKDQEKPTFLPTTCQRCPLVNQCMGGSRSQAHAWTGDWSEKDPWMQK